MDVKQQDASNTQSSDVPRHALLLSLISLWIPVLSSWVFPEWTNEDVGILIWLLALIPAFLLSFHKGWRGASVALAGGMAAFSMAQVIVVATDATLPPTETLLGLAAVLLIVALGSGWITTHLRHSLRSAEQMAFTDANTGLPNRRHALLHLERTFQSARRGGQMAVIIYDLDKFKSINDTHGHAVGDEVLQEFAMILRTRTRGMDVSARFGGEEFLTILQDCDVEGAVHFAEEVRKTLREHPFPWGDVTVSSGVAAYRPGMASPDLLVAAADQALYEAKEGGRDRVCVAGSELPPEVPDEAGPGPRPQSMPDIQGRGELVLVVEDQEATLNSVGKALRRLGYEVLLAEDPDHALEILRGLDEPVDLVLTDVIVPPTSGFRLVAQISTHHPDVRVVYMSGYVEEGGWEQAPGKVKAFLEKPFTVSALAQKIRHVLNAPAPKGDVAADEEADLAAPDEAAPTTDDVPDFVEEEAGARAVAILAPSAKETQTLAFQLQHLGYHDNWTDGDVEELAADSGLKPDLVLVRTAGSGEEQIARLRAVRQALDSPRTGFPPILALVDRRWPDLQWQAQHLGAFDYLEEPHELDELGVRVGNLLRLQRAHREEHRSRRRLESRLAARTAELEAARSDMLLRLARAAEFRDDLTGAHAERVGLLAGLIARSLNKDRSWCEILEHAAPLHDVGKIAVPDTILNKPTALTDGERRIMQSHTMVGSQLLAGSRDPMIRCAERIALCHHEAWDGSGYPVGLEGEEIPLAARIVAVADAFDSISSARPYREANTQERSVEIIRQGRGTKYDPSVVDAFLDVVRSGGLEALENVEVVGPDPREVLSPEMARAPAERVTD